MVFKEYGRKQNPILILIHKEMFTDQIWTATIQKLKKNYRIITILLDGHGIDNKILFHSIEDETNQIVSYIQEQGIKKIYAIYGISLGGQIALNVLARLPNAVEKVILESVYISKNQDKRYYQMPRQICFKNKFLFNLYARQLKIPQEKIENYYLNIKYIKKETYQQIQNELAHYSIPTALKDTSTRAMIIYGKKEPTFIKKSALLLNILFKDSFLLPFEKEKAGITIRENHELINLVDLFLREGEHK